MKKWTRWLGTGLAALLAASALGGCAGSTVSYIPTQKLQGNGLYVEKVENIPEDFVFGMDVSSVIALEQSGVTFYNFAGQEQDIFQTLAESGVTHIRVRVWNDPYDDQGRGFGGGNCDIEKAVQIGQRATKYGMKLILNFHYSDFWADPGKQMCPREWEGMDINAKAQALATYTTDAMNALKEAGVDVDIVQVGNETNNGMAGETDWANMCALMQAGSQAIRAVYPEARVAVHFANPENSNSYGNYAKRLQNFGVDYDIFASSYYPYWHGTLENLSTVLTGIAENYGKQVLVMEVSYAYTGMDTDFNGNTISDESNVIKSYPYTVQGQANCLRDVIDTVVNHTKNGMGVVYWEGAWITVGGASWEENSALWEQFGSGWASSYASVYDPKDAGQYFGGSAVDNQAMFDPQGHPLPSLQIFNLVRYGNDAALQPDEIPFVSFSSMLGEPVKLPETVEAVMTDNSRQVFPVTWNVTESELAQMRCGGEQSYLLTGTAQGMDVRGQLRMVAPNFLENPGFETGDLTGWTLTDHAGAEQLYVEDKITDSLSGTMHMHFWSPGENSVEFSLEQDVRNLTDGTYEFRISIMGGDAGDQEVYAYALVDGEMVGKVPMSITSYGSWDTAVITGIPYREGQSLVLGICVRCGGAGSGAWGKIDDAILVRAE